MDSRIAKLQSPEACERFIANAQRLNRPDLVEQARQRAVQLRAEIYGAQSAAEMECLQAIFAYEEVLSRKNRRRTAASRTWQMVRKHGILAAAERAVDRGSETAGFSSLAEMGLIQYAFEVVILRYPEAFSPSAVDRSRLRLADWEMRDGA